jgi:hypothetical protein
MPALSVAPITLSMEWCCTYSAPIATPAGLPKSVGKWLIGAGNSGAYVLERCTGRQCVLELYRYLELGTVITCRLCPPVDPSGAFTSAAVRAGLL